MSTNPPPAKCPPLKRHGPKLSSAEAQARLADALRDNLRRRKAQLRARDTKDEAVDKAVPGEGGETP
jgi:hypothetical protein